MTYTIKIDLTEDIAEFWLKFLTEQQKLTDRLGQDIIYHGNEALKPYGATIYRIKRNHIYDVYVDFPSEKEYMMFILRYS